MQNMRFGLGAIVAVASLLSTTSIASAATVFNGFGAGDSFNTSRVVSVANQALATGPNPTATDGDWAFRFTPTDNFELTSLEIALSHVASRGGNEGEIILRNASGALPGSEIERWSVSGLSTVGEIVTFNSVTSTLLSSGTNYWIELSAGTEGTSTAAGMGWQSSNGNSSGRARQFDEGAWQSEGTFSYAYRVNGDLISPVPLPAGMVLLPMGLFALGCLRRRKG